MVRRVLAGEFHEGPGYATYRSRGTTDWLLIHTVDGRGRFGNVFADPGTTTLIRPGTLHDYATAQRSWHFLFAHFHPKTEWLPLLDWPEIAPGILQLTPSRHAAERIVAGVADAVRYQDSVLPQGELLGVNALEAALLWADTQNRGSSRIDDRILRAVELVDRDLKADLDVSRLARACNLSVSRFSHLFRIQLGVTPQQFVERRRIEAARRLLELTSRSIASVAAEVGFTNPLYFSTRFRRHTGVTPTQYRRI